MRLGKAGFARLMLLLGLAISGVLIYLIGPATVVEKIQKADYSLVLSAILVYFLALLLGWGRWYLFGSRTGHDVHFLSVGKVYFLNCFVSSITPGRAGDVMAPLLISSQTGLPVSASGAIILIERFSDLFTLLIIALTSSFWLEYQYGILEKLLPEGDWNTSDIGLGLLMLLVFFLVILVFRLREHRLVLKARRFAASVKDSLVNFLNLKDILTIILLSFTNWFLHFLKDFLLFSAFIQISFLQLSASLSIANLVTVASFMPGGVGVNAVSHALIIRLMSLDWQGAATASLVGTAIFMAIRALLGAFFNKHLIFRSVSKKTRSL